MWNTYMLAMLTLLLTTSELPAGGPAAELRIRIYDYVPVDEHTLQNAQKEAARLLRPAGVQVVWLNCEILREDRPPAHPCFASLRATELQLSILDRKLANRLRRHSDCLGISVISEGFNTIGAVFYDRALELKERVGIPLSPILGAALAHEAGHLLLGETRHAKSGLMSGRWDNQTLFRISRNELGFASTQRRQIAIQFERRITSDQ
jgi:hypothetical protein